MKRIAIAAALLGALASCSLFGSELPDNSCESDLDCFRAQGEVCHLDRNECGPPADAMPPIDADLTPDATPLPDAPPQPDAGPTPDAGIPDAGAPDA